MAADMLIGGPLSMHRGMSDSSKRRVSTCSLYFGLRANGGDPGVIGLEDALKEHRDNLVLLFREVWRVLRLTERTRS